jgi:hypothetical protein
MFRSESADVLKASPPAAYLLGWAAGIDWGTVASVLACIYTAFLIVDKVWTLMQRWQSKRFAKKMAEPLEPHE